MASGSRDHDNGSSILSLVKMLVVQVAFFRSSEVYRRGPMNSSIDPTQYESEGELGARWGFFESGTVK